MRVVFLLTLGLVAAAGCLPDASAPGRAAIVDGTFEEDEPAVVVVKAFSGIGLCTGTLISPNVVLTAKHCVQAPGADRPYPASTISVGFGSDAATTDDHRIIAVSTTPGRYTSMPGVGLEGDLVGIDVAAITLREPITTVEPILLGRELPIAGSEFTAVGFGERPGEPESGLKYKTTSRISSFSGNVLNTAMTICSGDSGGPAIIEGSPRVVVGVASFGEAMACPSRFDGYNLVAPFVGLIDAALIAAGDCPFEGVEVCNSIDDDCDGGVDEGCKALGEPCDGDDECAFGQLPERFEPLDNPAFCADAGDGTICTRRCDPTTPSASCESLEAPFTEEVVVTDGMYCASAGGCDGLCAVGTEGMLADGAACARDDECASLLCVDPGDGARRCLAPCIGSAGLCPVTEVCAAAEGACGACVAPELVSSPRGLGERCGDDVPCASSMCHESAGMAYCTRACSRDDECGEGFHCRDSLCALGPRSRTGEPCVTDGDCILGDTCPGGYCTHLCSTDGSCTDGFHCEGRLCGLDAGRSVLGERCVADAECTLGTCLEVGDGTRCTLACGGAGTCPPGLECRRVADALRCVPPDVVTRELDVPRLGGGGGCGVSAGRPDGRRALFFSLLLALLISRRRR